MPETKKTNTLIEKSIFNRPETKKTKILIEKSIRVLKTLQLQMRKGIAPFSTMPETIKHTLSLQNPCSIGLEPKKQKLSLENSSGFRNRIYRRPGT